MSKIFVTSVTKVGLMGKPSQPKIRICGTQITTGPEIMLLIKSPQFLLNHYEPWQKLTKNFPIHFQKSEEFKNVL